ncbi:histidine kinase [Planotetraspora phitsanulokensis]|uniref:histidine kinase n=1 Tax=Planotetraspora phitsanulokensis TaxID=575192 RepID=A0A8J3UD23_9ACTN|nr:histidine kinase [Planotetraspora phitsanulokensis]GII43239.1 two-component sensor histidine kinase [Planotetraspora phitsanulokensis]
MNLRDRLSGRPGILADAGLAVVFIAALVVTAVEIAGTWGGGYWQFDCAAGAVVCVIALARRRDRAWAAAAGLAVAAVAMLATRFVHLPAEPGPAMVLGLSVLVGSAIRVLPVPQAAAVAAGGLAVVAGTWLAAPPLSSGTAPLLNGPGWVAALMIGLGLRSLDSRRRAVAEKVRRDERLELARELHDIVAHHVTGIVVQAQAARLVARRRPDTLDACLADIESAGSGALAAMRRVVGILRDDGDAAPAAQGPEQLSDLVERFGGHGPEVHLRLPEGESDWPPEVTSTVYRVVQESLTNIVRHAGHARSVTVSVAQDRQAVTVEVVDDAAPVPARHHHRGGYGLVGMRERVEVLGGTLRAGPRPEAGWSVLATLPVPAREPR